MVVYVLVSDLLFNELEKEVFKTKVNLGQNVHLPVLQGVKMRVSFMVE